MSTKGTAATASRLKQQAALSSSTTATNESAYTAYNAVDEIVAKPVLGSDGAMKWQSFAQQKFVASKIGANNGSGSVAPTAPLKSIDRATGFTSWKEEREYTNTIRSHDNQTSTYTHFSKKTQHDNNNSNEITAKERKRIENRIINDNQEYFIPSLTFIGWKFDYIYTTKSSHGTGYYFDGMDSIKLLNGQIKKEDIPSSAKVFHPTTSETTSDTVKTSTQTNKKRLNNEGNEMTTSDDVMKKSKKKKKKKPKLPTIVDNPNHPLEQVAAILAQRQQNQFPPGIGMNLSTIATTGSGTKLHSALLDDGWEVARCNTTGKDYYYNRKTGERTWDLPQHPKQQEQEHSVVNESIVVQNNSDDVWKVATDVQTGKEYYYNVQTGETTWEKPTAL